MNEDIYYKFCERLNKNAVKLPLIEPVLNFLREICTEKQAKLGAEFPLGAHTVKALAGQLNREEKDLEAMLEEMADIGVIFVSKTDDGKSEYSLNPFAPGIIELQFLKGNETEADRKVAGLLKEIHESTDTMLSDLYKDPQRANKVLGIPGLRTLAVEEELPVDISIYPYEKLTEILDKEGSFAAGACTCRQQKKLNNDPCKVGDAPRDACIYFGKVADYMVDREFAKRLSREELLGLLKECEEAGLVHNINNHTGDNIVLCNCCSCCCDFLAGMKKYRGVNRVANSNFMLEIDGDSCTGCGDCIDRCQMEALDLVDDIALLNRDYCIGCGNCVSACPSDSLSMIRRSEIQPPERKSKVLRLGV